MAHKRYNIGEQFEIEVDEDDPVYIGTKIANLIERFFPKLAKRMKDKGCGCNKRAEKLNDLHWKIINLWN